MFRFYKVVIAWLLFIGCTYSKKQTDYISEAMQYATGFVLEGKKIKILEPWLGASQPIEYRFDKIPQRVVVTSTTHLPYLEYLGVLDRLVGFPGLDLVMSDSVIKLANQGNIKELGPGGQLNLELLLEVNPDLVIAFDMGNESTALDKIEEMGIPILYNSDYLETSPLGRAEWIKVFGHIFDKKKLADSIFQHIARTYDSVKMAAQNASYLPTVMTGVLYEDIWYLPGGRNSFSQLVDHAGGHYLWRENNSNGWLELSFESVVSKGQAADFWIGTSSFLSIEELLSAEERYVLCKPVFTKNVFNYSKRRSKGGGYDYFESAYARPDLVLKDLVVILHPELNTKDTLYYFEKLK